MTEQAKTSFDELIATAEACLLKLDESQKVAENAAASLGETIATIKGIVEENNLEEQFYSTLFKASPDINSLPND